MDFLIRIVTLRLVSYSHQGDLRRYIDRNFVVVTAYGVL